MLDHNTTTLRSTLGHDAEISDTFAHDQTANNETRCFARIRQTKRAIDIAVVLISAPLVLLVLALCALAIALESKGPVFFRQMRYGMDGRQFSITKFRTMSADRLDFSGARQTVQGDTRVTRVGRFLRRTCLDELPQLWDVLRGDMTLVGPRPHPVGMRIEGVLMEDLYSDYHKRLRLPPGLTGLSQINGNRGPVHEFDYGRERLDYDNEYIDNWSFRQDVRIMLLTPTLPFRKGCY